MNSSKSGQSTENRGSDSRWRHVPHEFQYLRSWAPQFGLRGLTVYFGQQPPLAKLVRKWEMAELQTAYETIAERGDGPAISAWCLSAEARTEANDAKECIRGLLLLFERLADRGLSPFTDGRVRFISPDPPPFNWKVLPPHLGQWEPWLKKFEGLRTEHDLFQYVQEATDEQVHDLALLKERLDGEGQPFLEWCQTNQEDGNPAEREAFQAGWLFLFVYFAASKIESLS